MDMGKYICDVCGYIYDPEAGDPDNGIDPGTPFAELPEDWVCPLCGLGKDVFRGQNREKRAARSFRGPRRPVSVFFIGAT